MGGQETVRPGSQARPMSGPSPRQSARILVIDDNVEMARGLAKLLERHGHLVQVACDGPSGLDVARATCPQFVLLDIALPGMDGYQVVAQLREEQATKDAVIIAISGYGGDEDRQRSHHAGFDYHLVKPIDHEELLEILSR